MIMLSQFLTSVCVPNAISYWGIIGSEEVDH